MAQRGSPCTDTGALRPEDVVLAVFVFSNLQRTRLSVCAEAPWKPEAPGEVGYENDEFLGGIDTGNRATTPSAIINGNSTRVPPLHLLLIATFHNFGLAITRRSNGGSLPARALNDAGPSLLALHRQVAAWPRASGPSRVGQGGGTSSSELPLGMLMLLGYPALPLA